MAVILVACRAVGMLARRLGQPQVVGEMIAGVLLGPSLLGLVAPAMQAALFPPETLRTLYVGAQLGVALYMFIVGLGFRTDMFRSRTRSAVSVSIAGMAVPLALALAMGPWLVGVPGLFSPRATLPEAVLFLGAAISITAFPMLARIIHERGLSGTPLGVLALAAGAIDDAVAWCVLAVVLASFGGGAAMALWAIAGGIAYAAFMLSAGRILLARFGAVVERGTVSEDAVLPIALILLMLCAWAMDAIGIHAVFGGFLLGVAMPRGRVADQLRAQLEPFAVVFLLPMFFTYSGLNTQLGLALNGALLPVAFAILAASIVGKFVACWAAARLNGEDGPTALAVGSLMNARGLMELIIINIGLQNGIIEPGLFAILVLMAIVTTLMATPLFEVLYGRKARRDGLFDATP